MYLDEGAVKVTPVTWVQREGIKENSDLPWTDMDAIQGVKHPSPELFWRQHV